MPSVKDLRRLVNIKDYWHMLALSRICCLRTGPMLRLYAIIFKPFPNEKIGAPLGIVSWVDRETDRLRNALSKVSI